MNPSRKKVPYPFCGLSSFEKYTLSTHHTTYPYSEPSMIQDHSNKNQQKQNNNLNFMHLNRQPLTITNEVLSIYQQSKALQFQQQVQDKIRKKKSQTHMEILQLIKQNTKIMQILYEYDQEIIRMRNNLRKIQEQYSNDMIIRNQQINQMRFPLNYLEKEFLSGVKSKYNRQIERNDKRQQWKKRKEKQIKNQLLIIRNKLQNRQLLKKTKNDKQNQKNL